MKRLSFLLLICCSLHSMASEFEYPSKASKVTVYHNGALVERLAEVELSAGTHELTFPGVSSKLILKSLKLPNRDITMLHSELIRKSTEEEKERLSDRKDALIAQMTLLESKYSESGFIKEVNHLEKMMQFYGQKIQEIKRDMRKVEKDIERAHSLDDIVMKNKDAGILKMTISIERPLAGVFEMKYVVGGIGWSPSYAINVENSSQKDLQMKYLGKLMNRTGEDWTDISLELSSASPIGKPIILPRPNNPWVLDNNRAVQNTMLYSNAGVQGVYNGQWGTEDDIEKLQNVEYQQISVPSFLKPRTLEGRFSIPSNGTVFTFPILSKKIEANYYYYGYPSLDPEVYLVAELVGWNDLGLIDGIADITFSGNEVGRSLIKWSEVKDTLMLPIGRDNSVFMTRKEIANEKYFKETWTSRKRRTTLAFEYVLKNNNPFPIDFQLYDQIPLSQTKSADIDIEELSDGDMDKKTGEVLWNMTLGQGENTEKRLIYTIDIDAGYTYSKAGYGKAKFRSISCPSF